MTSFTPTIDDLNKFKFTLQYSIMNSPEHTQTRSLIKLCHDAKIEYQSNAISLYFNRKSPNLEDALMTAFLNVLEAIPTAELTFVRAAT